VNLFAGLVRNVLPLVPKPLVGRVARRYVAGETLASALRAVAQLNAEGASCTVDILGEEVHSAHAAHSAARHYVELIRAVRNGGHDSSVSIKPTMLGLSLDKRHAMENIALICDHASQDGVFITIDMEDHSTTSATLEIYRHNLQRFGQVGPVLQAYLHRTLEDIEALPLPPEGRGRGDVRLCKGIYIEPEEIAYKGHQEIRDNYMRCLERLLGLGHYVGIATHDGWLIERAQELVAKLGLSRERYEFQMLLGVRPDLRRRLIAGGHQLRVYVPYGKDWYPYSIRRLRENPAVAWHVTKALLTGK
jgi:proline dehydrogenase